LDAARLVAMYAQMVRSRTLDERVWLLNRQGKVALMSSAQGHEAAQVATVHALRPGQDWFYTYYRDLAVVVALGVPLKEIMLGYLAKAGEPFSGARQFPAHGAYPKYHIVNPSNVVGTRIPQAVGAALAAKMRREDTVVIVYFGDGAASTGDCHEGMNFASIHKLPVIFFCENNRYAISVPLSKQMAISNVAARAQGYGMPGLTVDGTDVAAVYEATAEAAGRARAGHGPAFIEAMVERNLPHTSDDDDRKYRSKEELDEVKKRDPVAILKRQLEAVGALSAEADARIHAAAKREADEATEFGEAAPYPTTEGFYDHVYASPGGAPSQ
jgi:2-oxoisovalerate dehydrogenase E1 component alpha subunit